MTDRVDLLRVARVYEEALRHGIPPRKAVADVFGMALSTASSWIASGRKVGLIPPAGEGHRPAVATIRRGTKRQQQWQACEICHVPWKRCMER